MPPSLPQKAVAGLLHSMLELRLAWPTLNGCSFEKDRKRLFVIVSSVLLYVVLKLTLTKIPRKWSLCYCSVFIVDFEQILHIGVSVVGFEKVNASCSYAKGRLDLLLPLGIFFEGPEFHFLEELHKHVSTNCFYCYKENF